MSITAGLPKRLTFRAGIFTLILSLLFAPFLSHAEAEAAVSNQTTIGQDVTKTAKKYLGVKYKEGGTTPKGFDASGFTKYVFDESKADLKLPRTSGDQYKTGKAVSKKDIQEGDLLFFKTNGKSVSFVGIALNKQSFIAVTVSKGVSIQSIDMKYWKDAYVGAKRVLK